MIRKNIVANYVGRVWGFISVFLFTPIYLKFLGIEAYGLVGFYSTLLGVMVFADMGFTATLNREMARLSAREDSAGEMRDLLRTYEVAYLCITFLIAAVIWVLSPLIAEHWLHSEVLQPSEIALAIRLMGVAVAFQLPSGMFFGGLLGLQRQVLANGLQISWGIIRGVGAVLILWLVSPTIFAFALWQLIANGIYFFSTRLTLWHTLSPGSIQPHPHFKWQVFRNTWRYAAGMMGMSVIFTILSQTDKLAVSKMLSLDMLGYYTLAAIVASVPSMLTGPIVKAVFPRLTNLAESGNRGEFVQLYHRTSALVAVVLIPVGVTGILFSNNLIFIWTGKAEVAQQSGLVASLLLAGALMQSITAVPYYVALAHGYVRLNLKVGIASICLLLPLLFLLIPKYGISGAGASWLVMNICIFPPYMYFLHSRFLPGELKRWCLQSLGRPLSAALPFLLLGRWLVPHTDSRLLMFLLVVLVWSVAVTATAVVVPDIRHMFIKTAYKFLGVPNEVK